MSGSGPGSGLIWVIGAMLGSIAGILTPLPYDPKREKGIRKNVKFEVPEDDEVSVTYEAPDGSSTQDRLYSRDVRRDFQNHGRHWLAAQKLDIHTFEEYWNFLLGDLDTGREPMPVDIKVTPLFDRHRMLNRIVISFRYLHNGKLSHEFKEMSLEVPEAKNWHSEQAWRQQTAHIRCKHGNAISVKIGDLGDFEYDTFKRAVHHVRELLRSG